MLRPDLAPKDMVLDVDYVRGLLGLELTQKDVAGLLRKMRFGVREGEGKVTVSIPPYRADIMHPIDLVEDVAIAYGYMNFKPQAPRLHALGRADRFELYSEEVRDYMVGLQFREVMTLMLTNNRDLFERMSAPTAKAVEALKPVSADQGIVRTWLLPSLLVVLEKNRNREYPQRVFEVGEVLAADGTSETKVAAVIAHAKTNFSEVKAAVGGLLGSLKLDVKDEPYNHPSYIPGRCSQNRHGFLGELSPQVLTNFGLEVPVTAFELKLN
jgi:phenylalanyl-tRNA synthetase beta chain